MDEMADIIMRRRAPGILIFDRGGTLRFSNKEASELISSLPELCDAVWALCLPVRDGHEPLQEGAGENSKLATVYRSDRFPPFAIRVFPLGEAGGSDTGHLMVLLEKIVEKHALDLEKAKAKFHLSKRELEVLCLIGEGLANREIAEKLFIGEQTAKDHVRNIMRKVGVNSRGALISALQ
jgi:DNA-binding CsgD family transcriptional regulator